MCRASDDLEATADTLRVDNGGDTDDLSMTPLHEDEIANLKSVSENFHNWGFRHYSRPKVDLLVRVEIKSKPSHMQICIKGCTVNFAVQAIIPFEVASTHTSARFCSFCNWRVQADSQAHGSCPNPLCLCLQESFDGTDY